eukprot:NODE_161_length_14984_cov_0.487000.p11 type:complete len:134 gc:universal NODE_161_length_14984_cov_0.487000:2239-2640(+)
MLQNDVIEPSNSDWRSAVVLMTKPDGSVRFCVNYKQLNKHTKFDAYPLPDLNSRLELKSGYWQINLADPDKEKTAFVTPFGLQLQSSNHQLELQILKILQLVCHQLTPIKPLQSQVTRKQKLEDSSENTILTN